MRKTYVLSVGGSLIVPAGGPDVVWLKRFRALILGQVKAGDKFFLVIGGGTTARLYQRAAIIVGAGGKAERDWLGISATRLNAQMMKTIFSDKVHAEVIINPNRKVKTPKPLVLAAGYKPGWSTDYDAVLIAKNHGADTVINLSNIDYAYDKDPKKFKDAKKLVKATWPEFRKVVGFKWRPGLNLPFDPIASGEAAKHKMRVIILNGRNLKNLRACLLGKKFRGTTIA